MQAQSYELNYIINRLDSLKIGNINGLHELDSIMMVRIDLLEQDVIKAAPNADSLRNIICNSPDIDTLSLYAAIEKVIEPKVAGLIARSAENPPVHSLPSRSPKIDSGGSATENASSQDSITLETITPAENNHEGKECQNQVTKDALGTNTITSEGLTEKQDSIL